MPFKYIHLGQLPRILWPAGWWLTYPSEKYESAGMIIPNQIFVIEMSAYQKVYH